MVICTVEVNEKSPQTIVIGRRGTYNTQEVVFDIGYLINVYGAGTAVLAIKRSQDSSAYPTVVTQKDTALIWTVSETDTYYVGAGECQLMWYIDGGLAKTIIYPFVVMRDILSTSEEAPDAYQEWVDNLTSLGAETLQNAHDAAQSASDAESAKDDAVTAKEAAEKAAEKAEEASVHSPVIQGGYWYIWNNGQYVNTGVQAEGQKGDKGDPGEKGDTGNGIASITKTGTSGLVDTYTVTYTDGTTTTFTVTNGAKGDKGDTGATGNGIQSITKTGTSGNVDTYTITYTNGQTTTFTVTNGAVSSVAGKTGVVTLDANDVAFSESGTYDDGTVGKELSDQKNAIDQNEEAVADTQSMIATVEATTTASKNYAVGDLLVYDGKLYKVTSAIATGATIIVGSNVTQTTIANDLSEISKPKGYTLIETFTLDEAAASITRSSDPNGKPYKFRKVAAIITLPTAQAVRIRMDAAYTTPASTAYMLFSTVSTIGSVDKYFIAAEQDGAFVYSYGNAFKTNNSMNLNNAIYGSPRYVQTEGYYSWAPKYTGQPFIQIALSVVSNSIPAGTTIEIYGVWA